MMLCYAYLKGARLGFLVKNILKRERSCCGIETLFYEDDSGYHLGGICEVAGLDNEADGSAEYYLSEKLNGRRESPFILAFSELL